VRERRGSEMTILTMRVIRGHFVVTGPDIEPVKFNSRREAKEWCWDHHPGSPIREIGAHAKRVAKPKVAKSE
jgi:hypothetical protein